MFGSGLSRKKWKNETIRKKQERGMSMTNQDIETGARTPQRKLPLVVHILLAQAAVLLCCLITWYLCENAVPKQYSDATYRTELVMMDNNYNAMGYLKGEGGKIAALQYNKVSDVITKKPFYQEIVDEMGLLHADELQAGRPLSEQDLTAGRLMDRVKWGYDEADTTGRTITIDVTYADPAEAEIIGNRLAEKLNVILTDKTKLPGPPINQPNRIEHTGLIREPVRTGPNTLVWVIIAGLIAEGIFLTMAFQTGWKNKVTCVLMGFANLSRGQVLRGLLFFLFEVVAVGYMIGWGVGWLQKLPTLGTVKTEHYALKAGGQEIVTYGDDSFKILLYGVLTIFFIGAIIYTYYQNVKQGRLAAKIEARGKKLKSGREDLRSLVDDQFHKTLLALPVTGIILFTVMPIIFMVLVAFTNYSGPLDGKENLFTWVGLDNFNQLLTWTSSGSGNKTFMATFGEILAWTLIWAFFATFTNYFLGMFVAMAINKKGIKLKKMWRTILVMTIAIPQFISLLYVSKMFDKNGIINSFLINMGWIKDPIEFFGDVSRPWLARVTVIVINIWIGIPYLMLITTGILMNIPADLYESARIDGANPWQQYTRITLPYMLFVTGPYLLTSFTGNMNNFNVIYLLTGGAPTKLGAYSAGGVSAGQTDLLITWLFNITQGGDHLYYQASVVGILVFVVVALITLLVYSRLPSNKNEEDFQ